MRIIAGKYGGLSISAPAGLDVRPTTDRVREAMFSSLTSLINLEGARVLDAFAGSGALGIEALSRGAEHVVFCEQNKRTLSNLVKNLEFIHAPKTCYKTLLCDVIKTKVFIIEPINVLFLDPPYKMEPQVIMQFIKKLADSECLAPNCIVVYEHSAENSQFEVAGQFNLLKQKRYGKIAVSFLKLGE